MKLCDLFEARYLTNYFLAVWADEGYWAKRGFTGATKAPVGEYQVTGHTHEMFRPDWERFRKNDAGWILVLPTLKEVEQAAIDLDVHLDDGPSRDKFGMMIGRHKDFERLDEPYGVPDRIYEARYREHPAVNTVMLSKQRNEPLEQWFELDELDGVIKALIRAFGEPEHHEGTWMTGGSTERWIWKDCHVARYSDKAYLETHYGIPARDPSLR